MSYDLLADWPRLAEAIEKAPSIFNTRPWSFRPLPPDHIELRLPALRDMDKALARESVISCGAALYNLRLAIRVAGHDLEVWPMPKPHDKELLASVEIVIGRIKKPTPWEQGLYEAIGQRHTNRWPYTILPAPLPIIAAMEDAAIHEGAYLRLLHSRQAGRWMRLSAKVDKAFTAHFPNYVSPANCGPRPTNRSPVTRKDFWRDEKQRFERKPQLMALSTDDDQPLDWLRAGQALQRALLTGTRYSLSERYGLAARYHAPPRHGFPAHHHLLTGHDDVARHGLSMSFLTQPLEYDDINGKPRRWPWRWRFPELPQMIIRVGYPEVAVPGEPPIKAQRSRPDEGTLSVASGVDIEMAKAHLLP